MKTEFDRNIAYIIHDIARLQRWRFDLQSQELGLTRAQWIVLAHLNREDGIRQKTLANIMEIAPISLTRLLNRLEANTWIERKDDPTDRRAKNVYLTPKAAPMIKKLSNLGEKVLEKSLRGISVDDRAVLLKITTKIRENLSDSKSGN